MANAQFYGSVDFSTIGLYYGEIEVSNSTTIRISNGYHHTTYGGHFSYDYYGNIYGNIYSMDNKQGVTTTSVITGINLDAHTLVYTDIDDPQAFLSYVLSGADRLDGSGFNDRMFGYSGNDVLLGNGGEDKLYGDSGNDSLYGGWGSDWLDGGVGADYLSGGTSHDTYIVNSASDRVIEGADGGWDLVRSYVNHTLSVNVEKLTLVGSGSIDGTGNTQDNTIVGNAGQNTLNGWSGNDVLNGYGGSDDLISASGTDLLSGGAGYDTFVFRTAGEAGLWSQRDVIQDFDGVYDWIDVSGIDANTGRSGNQAFTFIGSDTFTRSAGQLRLDTWGILRGDTNGDGADDFQIEVAGLQSLTAGYDLVL